VRGPHSLADLYAGVATLERYLALIAVATRLTECVLRAPELARARRRVVAGFSLGGLRRAGLQAVGERAHHGRRSLLGHSRGPRAAALSAGRTGARRAVASAP
jgi:hypothetical protein